MLEIISDVDSDWWQTLRHGPARVIVGLPRKNQDQAIWPSNQVIETMNIILVEISDEWSGCLPRPLG